MAVDKKVEKRKGYKLVDNKPEVTDIKLAPKYLYLAKGKNYTLVNKVYVLNKEFGKK